MAVLTQTG